MAVYLRIQYPNGEIFDVPADIIAQQRAAYYAESDACAKEGAEYERIYADELEYTLSSEMELADWAKNNMDWSDFEAVAVRVVGGKPYDYRQNYRDVEMERVERADTAHGSDDTAGDDGDDVPPAQATPAGDGVQARETPRLMSSEERGEMMHNANAAAWRDGLNKLGSEIGVLLGDKISDTPDKAIKLIRDLRAELNRAQVAAKQLENSPTYYSVMEDNATLRAQLAAANARAEKAEAALTDEDTLNHFANLCRQYPNEAALTLLQMAYLDVQTSATPDADTEADDAAAEDSAARSI